METCGQSLRLLVVLAAASCGVALAACGGGGDGGDLTEPHQVAGVLSPSPGEPVTVALTSSGGGTTTVETDEGGAFLFEEVAEGEYSVAPDPSRPYAPPSREVIVGSSPVGRVVFTLALSGSVVLPRRRATWGAAPARTGSAPITGPQA
jgi:hypothetical protein